MSIIRPESRVFQIVSGVYKGRTCVIFSEGVQITDAVKIVFTDNYCNESTTICKGQLAELDAPGWEDTENSCTYGLEEYFEKHNGSGTNLLRTPIICQPRALRRGDVLATGEKVVENRRRGCNSSDLIHLDQTGWVELASRLPIALQGNENFSLPIELMQDWKLATGCLVVEKPISLKVNWTIVTLDHKHCDIEIPSCMPLALA